VRSTREFVANCLGGLTEDKRTANYNAELKDRFVIDRFVDVHCLSRPLVVRAFEFTLV
jgi:hypothetical protein